MTEVMEVRRVSVQTACPARTEVTSLPTVKRRFHWSHLGSFGSLSTLVIVVLLGFILFNYYHLTFQGLLQGFLHFLW